MAVRERHPTLRRGRGQLAQWRRGSFQRGSAALAEALSPAYTEHDVNYCAIAQTSITERHVQVELLPLEHEPLVTERNACLRNNLRNLAHVCASRQSPVIALVCPEPS